MAKQTLGLGSAANDNTGDTLRAGGDKINDNFSEVYTALGNGSNLTVTLANPAVGHVLRYNGTTFLPSDYTQLTSALDVNGNSIISASNGNIVVAPNGTGNVTISNGSVTSTFNGTDGIIDMPTKVKYKNEYANIGSAPAAASYAGYFFTVDGDDNPYVNMNITAGGVGDVQAKVLTEYSSLGLVGDVDTTTAAPTDGQLLKWSTSGSKWAPADDLAGAGSQNLFESVVADTGTTTADAENDTLTLAGGSDISTSISGDTVTINYTGTPITTFAGLTDSDLSGIVKGDSIYWNNTDWVVSRSPVIWWNLNASGSSDYTFSGPGFTGAVNDPNLYVYRGFTYIFDNSVQGGAHPFRLQSTQGLTGTPYTAGQSGSGSNILYWTVPLDSPATLYYQCTLHAAMNGTINVAT
tara:strand:+ start:48885 stop:50111 length:1227 start_codon:yes stop_codon:yes gene_type:complete